MHNSITALTTIFKGLFNHDFEKRAPANSKNSRSKTRSSISDKMRIIYAKNKSDIAEVKIKNTRSNDCIIKATFTLKNNKKIIVYCNYENGYYYRAFDGNSNKISEKQDFKTLEGHITSHFTRQ